MLGENPAAVLDAGTAEPFKFGFVVGIASEGGFGFGEDGETARQNGEHEDRDHHDNQGDA